jgi:hypothetical protein
MKTTHKRILCIEFQLTNYEILIFYRKLLNEITLNQ